VERDAGPDGELAMSDPRFFVPSRLTRPDDALRAAATELMSDGAAGLDLPALIMRRVHEHFDYRWGVTTVATTAAEAWAGHAGVCQDYAHCMISLCRLCGLGARYVSGQLLGEGGAHAWVEVRVPDGAHEGDAPRVVAFDPTHDRCAGLRYATVAVGRDYADVPPTSGTFDAPYTGTLTTHKHAAVTRVEYVPPPALPLP
jgi:transglutaminase-like putative cysteine protease